MESLPTHHLTTSDGIRLAYRHHPGDAPGVLFMSGYRSDMMGSKVLHTEAHCREQGIAFTCFDYRGHGQSGGDFDEAGLSDWINDACHLLEHVCNGKTILIGSSMSGHIMLHVAARMPERAAGLIGIAAAPDFTESMRAELTEDEREEMRQHGVVSRMVYAYDDPFEYRLSQHLLDDGRQHLWGESELPHAMPVILLHGKLDDVVPYAASLKLKAQLPNTQAEVVLFEKGDHRLSSPEALSALCAAIDRVKNVGVN